MIKSTLFFALLLVSTSVFAQQASKEITVKKLWENYEFSANRVPGFNFMQDGKHYAVMNRGGSAIESFDLTTGVVAENIFKTTDFTIDNYHFSGDESKLILETSREQIYRRSSLANFWVYDRATKSLKEVSSKGKQGYATLNTKGDAIAFVRENNIFYKSFSKGKEIQLTTDGAKNKIINGSADWVYEEEFAMAQAFSWSPDGKYIAYLKFDESEVKEFTMPFYLGKLYPVLNTFKYPKAGEVNSTVTVHIYDIATGKTKNINVKGEKDQYIPRIVWTKNNELCITRVNRHQNHLALLLANPKNGKAKQLFEERNPYFIDVQDNLTFLENGQFIWTSDADGFNHIYLYSKKGKLVKQLTKGKFDVIQYYGYDKKRNKIFFQAALDATERGIYAVSLKGGELEKLHHNAGKNNAQFSSTFDFYVETFSKAGTPPSVSVFETDSKKVVRVIEENKRLKSTLESYNLGGQEFFEMQTKDSVTLKGWMIKPADFDPNKKYPVLMYVYGGPGKQTVMNGWGGQNYMWFQMLAQKGYIVVSVDNRGTDARGEAFRKSTYLNLGKYETSDQIEVAKYLQNKAFVDESRIGIFGWSFGGYLSTLCLAKGSDVFKMAIAVAPVINWKWYDTVYTERFMRTPKENNAGYEDNSPINFAKMIKGSYLLVHGIADDNVHFQNAAEMSNALIKNNIPFDEAFYPNKNHGIYGGKTRAHLFNKLSNYVLENL